MRPRHRVATRLQLKASSYQWNMTQYMQSILGGLKSDLEGRRALIKMGFKPMTLASWQKMSCHSNAFDHKAISDCKKATLYGTLIYMT